MLSLFVLLLVAFSCTQYKNTVVTRGFHNLTSRYNVYFYAVESRKEGEAKLLSIHKDDYNHLLPLYVYGNNENVKEIHPEMDRVIKKSSSCITRHAIKDKHSKQEIIGAVRWIDNAWMEYGKAHFYKREFFTAIESFEYVANTYKSKERYEAWLWLVKTYNEMNLLSQSDPYINLIKNEKEFPGEFKDEFAALYADFYIKQGMLPEGIKQLEAAISLTRNRKTRARFHFILGQLYEEEKNGAKAIQHYDKVLRLKPAYDMVFNVKIKHALLAEQTHKNSEKIKADLLAMTKDIKNDEYQDVIYYTLGLLEEREQHTDKAIEYYITSSNKSSDNPKQKARSFLKLGDIYFEKTKYAASEAYYDSTVAIITEDFPDYKKVLDRKKNLNILVGHIRVIEREDSLQKVAAMDSSARNKFIDKIIAKLIEDEQKALEAKQAKEAQAAAGAPDDGAEPKTGFGQVTTAAAWYFYNAQTRIFGTKDFIKKWGTRKLEDNWRRSSKESNSPDAIAGGEEGADSSAQVKKDTLASAISNVKSRRYYLKDLPLTPLLVDTSNKMIVEAYYNLGIMYREQFGNNRKSIEAFEALNKRFPKNKYEASGYYQMYRIYLADKNTAKAEGCKQFLLQNYPESDYSKIINDPEYTKTLGAKKSEVEAYYTQTYQLYCENKFKEALSNCSQAQLKYGKNDFSPKFSYLKALCVGRTQNIDSLEKALAYVTIRYPKDPVAEPAQAMLDLIHQKKGGSTNKAPVLKDSLSIPPTLVTDTFTTNIENTEHYWVLVVPEGKGDVNKMRSSLSDFNNVYYGIIKLESMAIPVNSSTLIAVKSLKNKTEAINYYQHLQSKADVFKPVEREQCSMFVISSDNLAKLIKNKNTEVYKTFFNIHYLNMKK